jgi:flavin reductase (DIM6/NTAB) family NADH-FMN oxidoreductase RutF
MSFNTHGFRKALGSFPTGIVVVTAGPPERYRGITVNSFASLSLDPPLVLWCIARASRRYETFTKASEFAVSVLGEGQRAVADRIAVAGEGDLGDIALETVANGPPAIARSLAVFECRREAIHDGGDHVIIVGRVNAFRYREDDRSLTFFRGRYGKMGE